MHFSHFSGGKVETPILNRGGRGGQIFHGIAHLFLYDQNIFEDCLEISSNLWQSLEIFRLLWRFSENNWKCAYQLQISFEEFSKMFGNIRKMFGNLWEIAKITLILLFIY